MVDLPNVLFNLRHLLAPFCLPLWELDRKTDCVVVKNIRYTRLVYLYTTMSKFSEPNMITAELWRIFTHYSLHADANAPEIWRITCFSRFAKDCQITGPRFTSAQLELEIVRLLRDKQKEKVSVGEEKASKDFGSNHIFTINFPEFLELLGIFALRVYPINHTNHDKETSLRRLLLENVLLLAQRRGNNIAILCEEIDENAVSLLQKDYKRSIMTIFNYYIELADKRRSQDLAKEGIKAGVSIWG